MYFLTTLLDTRFLNKLGCNIALVFIFLSILESNRTGRSQSVAGYGIPFCTGAESHRPFQRFSPKGCSCNSCEWSNGYSNGSKSNRSKPDGLIILMKLIATQGPSGLIFKVPKTILKHCRCFDTLFDDLLDQF